MAKSLFKEAAEKGDVEAKMCNAYYMIRDASKK